MPHTDFQKFSAIQFYLAHARNTVHVIFDLDDVLEQAAFDALVADVIAAAPQLMWRESLTDGGHYKSDTSNWQATCQSQTHPSQKEADAALSQAMSEPLHDTDHAAFRAIRQTIAGQRTRISFQTTHALMEGGDVSDLLRGRVSQHEGRPFVEADLSLGARIGVWALIPLIWGINVGMAAFERKERSQFDFARLRFNRDDLKQVAQAHGISQRDLAFSIVSHHRGSVPKAKKRLFAAYTSLPPVRVHLCDDEYLNVRMDDFTVSTAADAKGFLNNLTTAINTPRGNPMFTQTWHRRVCQIHQAVHPRFPWMIPKKLFGFAPYDVVLSLVPPVRPGRRFATLKGARISAGSDTGTAESCIFAATPDALVVTLWSGSERARHVAGIKDTARQLGVRVA